MKKLLFTSGMLFLFFMLIYNYMSYIIEYRDKAPFFDKIYSVTYLDDELWYVYPIYPDNYKKYHGKTFFRGMKYIANRKKFLKSLKLKTKS